MEDTRDYVGKCKHGRVMAIMVPPEGEGKVRKMQEKELGKSLKEWISDGLQIDRMERKEALKIIRCTDCK